MKKNDTQFVHELMIPNTGMTPNQVTGVIDITDYAFNFVDEFNVFYTATTASGERVVLDGIEYTFSNLLFKYAEGNFDPINFGFDRNQFNLDDLIENSIGANFTLADPNLHFTIKNSVGMPMKARAVILNAITEDGEIIPFESELTSGISVNFPSFDEIGKPAYTTFTINKDNSNIVDIINARPTQFEYQLEGTVFPEGGTTTGYALDSSAVEASFMLEVPLWGSVKDMEIEETTDLDTENFDQAESLELKILATNAFPIEAAIQVYFEAADGTIIETLVDDPSQFIVASAEILNGVVINPVITELNIPVSADKMAGIMSAAQIRLSASISTSDGGSNPVRFFSNYTLDLKVGIKAIL